MSFKNRFRIYVAVLHVALAALVVPLVVTNRWWLVAVEAFFVLSVLAGFRLVRGLFENLDLLAEGARFLDEQEFTTRFKETGRPERDRLVSLYNRLADDLREERTKLREQHHFLSEVLDASPSGVVVLDFAGRIELVNPAAARLLGLGPSVIGLPVARVLGPDLAAVTAVLDDAARAKADSVAQEVSEQENSDPNETILSGPDQGIDVNLGGHLHTVYNPPIERVHADEQGRYIGRTVIVNSGAFAKYVAQARWPEIPVSFEDAARATSSQVHELVRYVQQSNPHLLGQLMDVLARDTATIAALGASVAAITLRRLSLPARKSGKP